MRETIAEPVFLVSSPCSRSTLLCSMLARNPGIFASPGLNILIKPMVEDFLNYCVGRPRIAHGLLRTIAQLYSGEQTLDSIEMARRWIVRRSSASSERVVRELCRKIAPARLIDRCLLYAKDMDLLRQIHQSFPDALFLHLSRHPLEQGIAMLQSIEGVLELFEDESVDHRARHHVIDPQYAWFETQATIMEFSDALVPDQYYHVRAEDLVTRPEHTLRRLCAWLRLPFTPKLCEKMCHHANWPFAGPGPYNAHGGTDWEPPLAQLAGLQFAVSAPSSLDEALPWRSKTGLAEPVKVLAHHLGY